GQGRVSGEPSERSLDAPSAPAKSRLERRRNSGRIARRLRGSHADVHLPVLRSHPDLRDSGKGLRGGLGCGTVFYLAAAVRFLPVVVDPDSRPRRSKTATRSRACELERTRTP